MSGKRQTPMTIKELKKKGILEKQRLEECGLLPDYDYPDLEDTGRESCTVLNNNPGPGEYNVLSEDKPRKVLSHRLQISCNNTSPQATEPKRKLRDCRQLERMWERYGTYIPRGDMVNRWYLGPAFYDAHKQFDAMHRGPSHSFGTRRKCDCTHQVTEAGVLVSK